MIKPEYRERTIVEKYPIYITSDNKEFEHLLDAQLHEAKLQLNRRSIKKISIELFDTEEPANIYYVSSPEDFQYLIDTELFEFSIADYIMPGWYLVVKHSGGDSFDWHEVHYMPRYLASLKSWIKEVEEKINI